MGDSVKRLEDNVQATTYRKKKKGLVFPTSKSDLPFLSLSYEKKGGWVRRMGGGAD